ncbi:Ff.00g077560.m01.CDS01 [Fusarium sp. VM40]|nr:Ff.00g077560.m01.CDS01 [Fusarium sp. VM40]
MAAGPLINRLQDLTAAVRPSIAIAGLLVVFLTLWSALSTWRQYNRLSNFKGPRLAAVSKWWLITRVGGGRAYLDFWEVTKKYGSIARVGPNDLVTDDPELMRHILNVRTEYRRSDWYDGMRFNPGSNNILSWRDEDEHFKLRSKMSAGYGGREVQDLEPKIDKNILAFIQLLRRYADNNKPVDLGRRAQFFTLDVISDLAFGEPFGFLETDSDVYKYIQITEETLPSVMVTTVVPWLVKVLSSPLFKKLLPSEKDRLGFGKLMGVAGSDTTATAIRSTMLHIITNPQVYAKLRAEIANTTYTESIIPDSLGRELPYLQAVIKEGLRIFPPVAGLMAKQVPPQGDTWKGQFIPGGTKIGYCAWGIFRREDIWGSDAGEFRPERWLESEGEKLKEMESALELIFSYGRWQCLGRPVALMELNKVYVELLRRFDFSICDPTNPWKVFNCGIFSQSELMVRIQPRE